MAPKLMLRLNAVELELAEDKLLPSDSEVRQRVQVLKQELAKAIEESKPSGLPSQEACSTASSLKTLKQSKACNFIKRHR